MVGATGPGALEERRNWRRMLLLAAPWGVAAVLGVLGVHGARGASTDPAAHTQAFDDEGLGTSASSPQDDDPAVPASPTPTRSTAPAPGLPPDVELAVLASARVGLGTAGVAGAEDAVDRWTVHAHVAAVEAVTAEHAVATVHGLVIEHRDDAWHGPQPEAVAVLVRTSPSPGVVGRAWPLAPPPLANATLDLRPLAEVDPSVVAPLEDAGWSIEDVIAVEASSDALLRVAVRGTPPARQEVGDHVLWLLDAPGGPRLLPLQPHHDTEELP